VTDGKERRRFKRVMVTLPTTGRCREEEALPFEGQTRDLSVRGLCVNLTKPNGYKVGQSADISIDSIQGEMPIQAHGLVRWTESPGEPTGQPMIGVELTGMRTVRDYERWLEMLSWHGL